MIFVDETGKRWKRIKLSTAGMVAAGVIPVAALVAGSFAYQPNWGALPLVEHAGNILAQTVIPQSPQAKPSPVNPASKPSAKAATPVISNSPNTTQPQPTTQPAVSTSPAPTPAPATTPGNSDFGHSHQPTH